MQISRIVALPNHKVRVSLIENLHVILPLDIVLSEHLKTGQVLNDQQWLKLTQLSQSSQLINKAIKWATLRPHSIAEFDTWATKNIPPDQVDFISAKLHKLELLDDVKFTKWWVQNRQSFRPRSKQELKAELRFKGIESQILNDVLNDVDESFSCEPVARKYFKRLSSYPPQVQKQKLFAYLSRRGFSYSQIKQVTDQILSGD